MKMKFKNEYKLGKGIPEIELDEHKKAINMLSLWKRPWDKKQILEFSKVFNYFKDTSPKYELILRKVKR